MDNLRFIRQAMEQAAPVTAVSGWGLAAVGGLAALMAPIAHSLPSRTAWVLAWLGTGVLALGIVAGASLRKARRADVPMLGGVGRKVVLGFVPAMAVGALLTAAAWARGDVAILPAIWLLLYGTAVCAVGIFSVRPIPIMGLCFLLVGGVALVAPAGWGDLLLGTAFGGLHLAFGLWVGVRHGG